MNPIRGRSTGRFALLAFLGTLALSQAGFAAGPPVIDPTKLKEVDLSGLSEAQKKIALKIMGQKNCNCGCEMSIAECRERDSSCRRSLIFARTIIDALREGKSEAEVVRVLDTKASTFVAAKLPEDSGVVYNIDIGHSPTRGPKDAPVTIVEFSDFQCPFCAEVESTLQQVLKAFPKEVRLIYKQYPLNIHPYARQAAVASLAANAQGKFWPMHDKLFQNFQAINEENIKKWAREVGVNMAEFEKAMQSGQHEPAVQKDLADGAAARVMGTPTLFVNGKHVHERSFDFLKKTIQEELAALQKTSTTPATAKPRAGSAHRGSGQ
ncbi:MAG TPA: thioredoxin domain-containing protein [Candidatus Polarisedimenticolia bacterium]|nr:thioredoxin domain-containing protein [Candidatus Polarisedimenticolia bacterium]